jgi:hypothetical protein
VRDDVHRRRHGRGRHLRSALTHGPCASTLDFLLNDWLLTRRCTQLLQRPRFADHSAETFSQVLDTCERIAREKYAPVQPAGRHRGAALRRREGDPAAGHAGRLGCLCRLGHAGAAQDYDIGGMQLPYTVELAANAFFSKASVSIGASMLTVGNANLLMVHGTRCSGRCSRSTSSAAAGRAPCACPSRRPAAA